MYSMGIHSTYQSTQFLFPILLRVHLFAFITGMCQYLLLAWTTNHSDEEGEKYCMLGGIYIVPFAWGWDAQ